MGYYLRDHPNPYHTAADPHHYPTRRRPILAVVVHGTGGLEDLDGVDDQSAEKTAAYAASTTRQVSWHSGSDTDTCLELLPPEFTAFHCIDFNSSTYGHELSKRHMRWSVMPEDFVAATLARPAPHLRAVATRFRIPIRRATKAELLAVIALYDRTRNVRPVGFISHAELDPTRRTDPGADFPWARFLRNIAGLPASPSTADGGEMFQPKLVQVKGDEAVYVTTLHGATHVKNRVHLKHLVDGGVEAKPDFISREELAQLLEKE